MRRANVQLAADRRSEILQAAQTCFARSGFHQASMQEICAEAGLSPGNLYRYFRSKEDIIAGLAALAQHHLVARSMDEIPLCAETMAESRRNPAVARIDQNMEKDVHERFI